MSRAGYPIRFDLAVAAGSHLRTNKWTDERPGDTGPFVPPVALQINSPHGAHLLALGRWKWRSQGGYPTLTHGGLSLLEVLSPFVELTK